MMRRITFHLTQGIRLQPFNLPDGKLLNLTFLVLLSLAVLGTFFHRDAVAEDGDAWVGTWGTAPAERTPLLSQPKILWNKTVRLIVHTSTGGEEVRIRISNVFGTGALQIGAASIAVRDEGSAINPEAYRELTFGGQTSVSIPAGEFVYSDAVALSVPADSDLAVSLFFPRFTVAKTIHTEAFQTSYVVWGNATGEPVLHNPKEISSWPFLTGVEVNKPSTSTIVAFGDSITDGFTTQSGQNNRWPDLLSDRLQSALGVVNKGIGGNRLLSGSIPVVGGMTGEAGLERFDRDVLSQPGLKYVVVLLGINDLGLSGLLPGDTVSFEQMTAGYKELISRARAAGAKIYGATLLPFEGALYYTAEKDALRVELNEWIRTSGEFDAVIDFDKAIQDPDNPSRMLPAYDSGDNLHPNDAGMQAMADSIPLDLFQP